MDRFMSRNLIPVITMSGQLGEMNHLENANLWAWVNGIEYIEAATPIRVIFLIFLVFKMLFFFKILCIYF